MNEEHLRVPYLARLDNLIQPGQSLVIRGIPNGRKFDLNLTVGPRIVDAHYEEDNVALRVNWLFNEKCISFNSMENGLWNKEERKKVSGTHQGQPFDIRIRAHASHYEIYLNKKKFASYRHRIALNMVNYIFVAGDLLLQTLAWEGNYYVSLMLEGFCIWARVNKSMPYKGIIPGHFGAGRRLFITGVPNQDAKSFHVNLHAAKDIAFRLTVNFSNKTITRNSRQGGQWDREEKDGKMAFVRNQQFDMAFYCDHDAIQVFVDNKRFCAFKHRISIETIDILTIEGDLQLHALALEPNLINNCEKY